MLVQTRVYSVVGHAFSSRSNWACVPKRGNKRGIWAHFANRLLDPEEVHEMSALRNGECAFALIAENILRLSIRPMRWHFKYAFYNAFLTRTGFFV